MTQTADTSGVPSELPVVVIGAGPSGLAAAVHLYEYGLPFLVLEAGDRPGYSVAEWGHVRLFSPWRYNTDPAACRLLESSGWIPPDPDHLPTGVELVNDYLAPLAAHPALASHVRYDAHVAALSRHDLDRVKTADREKTAFVVRLTDGTERLARAVIDASGTWNRPNPLGGNGLAAHGETSPVVAEFVENALPDVLGVDRDRFAGIHTLVVGGGHSAANTLLSLAELAETVPGTQVTWALRGAGTDRAYGGGDADALPGRGALGTGLRKLVESGRIAQRAGFGVTALEPTGDGQIAATGSGPDGEAALVVDRVVAATGFRPDHAIADELRLDLDPILGCTRALAPLIDPNVHSCGTVRPHGVDELTHPEPGYYVIGMKSYGRAPTFLLATGYEQARSTAAALAGDWDAARDVHLDLPETGVCSATAGAKAIATDAATRLGLPADIPSTLVSATVDHYFRTDQDGEPDLDNAVHAAAADLGIAPETAQQLAVLVSDQLHTLLDTGAVDGNGAVTTVSAPSGQEVLQLADQDADTISGGCCS